MKDKYVLTAESVTEGHPDKLCDTIAGMPVWSMTPPPM